MKKSINLRFAAMASLLALSMFFSSDLTAQTNVADQNRPFTEKAFSALGSNSFSFNILESNCFAGGKSLAIQIAQPENYTYLWEVNGSHGGHQMNQDCICGEVAKVRVMRLSNGRQVTRSIRLTSCGNENE